MESLKKPQKKLIHGICFHHVFISENQSKTQASFSFETLKRANLIKYFPKYIKNLRFDFSGGPLTTRIKRIKLVQRVSCASFDENFWRVVTANKRRTVQSFRQESKHQYSKPAVDALKMFPSTKKISLCFGYYEDFSIDEWKQQHYWITRISCNINHLNNLQYFKLAILSGDFFELLSKLKKSQRILSHLKVFEIELRWLHDKEYQVFQKFSTEKEILKHLTNLSLGILAGRDFFRILQLLPESCPKLTSLEFATSQKSFKIPFQSPYEFQDDIILEDSTSLKCLQNFNNLHTLSVSTYHGLDFLQYCQFPTSLRQLDLDFWGINWENLKKNSSKGLLEFNIQQENLHNLEKLKIGFTEYCEESDRSNNSQHDREVAINAFLQAFFKRIPTCKQLDLIISCSYLSQTEFKESPFRFDVSKFLESIEHFGQSLMKLNISDDSREYCFDEFDAVKSEKFSKLSSLFISSEISPMIDFENIFNFLPNNKDNEITLDGIKVKSSEELLGLLKRLGKLKNIIARNKRVRITVYVQELRGDEEYFERNYEDVKKNMVKLKNLFLTLRIKDSDSKFIQKLKSFKPLFEELQIQGKHGWKIY